MVLYPQRILFIGTPPGALPIRTLKFFDKFDVNDFQLMAWNAETLVIETQETTGQSLQSCHPLIYHRFKQLYQNKIVEILDWVKCGNVLVIFPYLFNTELKKNKSNGLVDLDFNQFPPFNLVNIAPSSKDSLDVVDISLGTNLSQQLVDILEYDIELSGEDIVPLFRIFKHPQGSSKIAGAAFRVGKGAIVFSPRPKVWSNPKLLHYLEALAKLPDILSQPVDPFDPLPGRTSALQRPAIWLAGLSALIIATIALSSFWSSQVERSLPWGRNPPAAGQEYAALAARLTEMEKRPAPSSFDVDEIKLAESALAHRVDQLEAALSRLQERPAVPPSNPPAAPRPPLATSPGLSTEQPAVAVPPAASPQLSTEEIAELLARGDALLRRGDIASARLFYERAASSGDGRAALRVGATFDPAFLARDILRGTRGDAAEARLWYQRARDLGEAEAAQWLNNLGTK